MSELMDHLPKAVIDLIDVVGERAALELVKAKGGIGMYVPYSPDKNHWLASILNQKEFKALCDVYGKDILKLPRCADALRHNLHVTMLKDMETLSQAEVAQKYNYTLRGVEKIVARYRKKAQNNKSAVNQLNLNL